MNGYSPPKDLGTDYPEIRALGRRLGSYGYYIDNELKMARQDKAPQNALYKCDDGSWATTDKE